MTKTIRAKLRCLHLTKNYDGTYAAELQPVYADGPDENEKFFEATPSGKCVLNYRPGFKPPYDANDCLYLDMELTDEDVDWRVFEITLHENNGSIQLVHTPDFDNDDAPFYWSSSIRLEVVRHETLELFGKPGQRMKLTLSPAPDED